MATIGYTAIGSSFFSLFDDDATGLRLTMPTNGTIQNIRVYIKADSTIGNIKGVIWNADGTVKYVGGTSSVALTYGWRTLTFSDVELDDSTDYYFGFVASTGTFGVQLKYNTGHPKTNRVDNVNSYSSPQTLTANTTNTRKYSIYANYTEISSSSSSSSSSRSSSSSSESSSSTSSSSSTTPGTITWGQHTGVVEDYDRDFAGNWTDSDNVNISGSGDDEILNLKCDASSSVSETWKLGAHTAVIDYDTYKTGTGPAPIIQYKTGTTEVNCDADTWHVYDGVSFVSTGWIKVKLIKTV